MRPFVLTPVLSRALVSNFAEFYSRGSLDWKAFSQDMKSALRCSDGLHGGHRWATRRMLACVCCARMYWSEEMERRHLAGVHADWLRNPSEVWGLLSVGSYRSRAPLIPLEELEASAVSMSGVMVLLH